MIRNKPQPKRNPTDGPYASRRKTYWPPARGHMAASSAQQSAPVIVSTPASAQAASSHPGAPTRRDDSAETMKIPEPIMDPTTIIVASSMLRPRMSLFFELESSSLMVRVHIVARAPCVKSWDRRLLACSVSYEAFSAAMQARRLRSQALA